MPVVLKKKNLRRLILNATFISLCVASSPPAWAADAVAMEEIIISAARTEKTMNAIPNTVRVIDQESLKTQLSLSTSLLDSLSFSIPSMTPGREKMTSSGVTLRGRTPLYLVDGIPQSTPLRNGERSAYTIDPTFVERVEVIFGANAIQGVGATGGVINTVTLSAPKSGDWMHRVAVDMTSDDFENDGLHYKVAGIVGKKSGANDAVVGVAYDRRDLYYGGDGQAIAVDPIQGDTMDSQSWNLFSKYGYDVNAVQRIELTANYFTLKGDGDYRRIPGDRGQGIAATSEKGREEGEPTNNEALNLAISYRHEDLGEGTLSAQIYYYDFYALYGGRSTIGAFQDASIAPLGTLFDQSALNSTKYGGKVTYVRENTLWAGLQIAAGLDYLNDETFQELAQTDRIWVPKMQFAGWAPFVQLEQAFFNERVRLSAGVRYENVTLDVPTFSTVASANNTLVQGDSPSFSEALTNFGVVYEPIEGLNFFTSYAQGFTMPDAGLILRSVNTPNQTVGELVDLQPVIADNAEVGLSYTNAGFNVSASYFQSDSELGSRIQVVNGAGQVRRERTEIDGVEFSGSYSFATGAEVGASYARLRGRYDSDNDNKVDRDLAGRNISPNRLNAWVQMPLGDTVFTRLQASKLYDRDFEGGLPEHDFDGYDVVDFLLRYDHGEFGSFSLGIQNALNEEYFSYYAQTITFNDNESFVMGRGRAIHVGWNFSY